MKRFLIALLLPVFISNTYGQYVFEKLRDCDQTQRSSAKQWFTYNNYLYFAATEDGTEQLWRTDGTEAGTEVFMRQRGVWGSSWPSQMSEYNGKFIVWFTDSVYGQEPFISDGTAAGTMLLKDINQGGGGSYAGGYTINALGKCFFLANKGLGSSTLALFVTDGTTAGTKQLISTPELLEFNILGEVNNKLLFSNNVNSSVGMEIYATDGTPGGTVLLKDLNPGSVGSQQGAAFSYNGFIYFSATNGTTGNELYYTDGTAAGTKLFKDIRPGSSESYPIILGEINGEIYYTWEDANNDNLSKFDPVSGVHTTIKVLSALKRGVTGTFQKHFGKNYFIYNNGVVGNELWESDGTAAGTKLFKDFLTGTASSSGNPTSFTEWDGKVFLLAKDNSNSNNGEYSLWSIDSATQAVETYLPPNYICCNPYKWNTTIGLYNDELYFCFGYSELDPQNTVIYHDYAEEEPYKLRKNMSTSSEDTEDKNIAFSVYPNPAVDKLYMDLAGLKAEQVSIYNATGKLVNEHIKPSNHYLDIINLATGIYIAEIRTKDLVKRVRWVKM